MTSSADQKFSLAALIALVVGSMVGSGIFALPAAFGILGRPNLARLGASSPDWSMRPKILR